MIISLSPELLGGDLSDFLRSKLGDYYYLSITVIFIITLVVYEFIGSKKTTNKRPPENVIEKAITDTRQGLIKSYEKRLEDKMAKRLPVNLQLKYSLEGTSTKAPLYDNRTLGEKNIKEELISIFDKHRGRLLITGEPGAGKTTLLLQLAVTLLQREKTVVPIIINMATWRSRFKSVEEWFEELLPQMGLSRSLAQELIKQHRILPLFDGLDELVEENRKPCLEAIGEFGAINELQYVICSRKIEYSQTVDAPVFCQIEVRPLTMSQIKKQLKALGTPESNGMLHAISEDPLLSQVIETPFYLNTVQILFSSSKSLAEFDFKTSDLEGRKNEVVEIFVQQQLDKSKYPKGKSAHWLSFLAQNLKRHDKVVFELADLQYSWSKWTKGNRLIANMMEGFIRGLMLGFVYSLAAGLFIGMAMGIAEGIADGRLVFGLGKGLIFATFIGLVFGLLGGLGFGLLFVLYAGLAKYLRGLIPTIETKDVVPWSLKKIFAGIEKNLLAGLLMSLMFGLIDGFGIGILFLIGVVLSLGLVEGLVDIFKSKHYLFIQISKPYQRFTASFYSLHFSIFQHWVLRRQLYKKGLLPQRLVAFLEELSENHILESDGATWRFRHRILQEYFADMWKEEK